MIVIIDYGLGNIQAFVNIYKRLNVPVTIASSVEDLKEFDESGNIILPGVGAFDWAMSRLDESGMRRRLDELVLNRCRPVLGVCVGMQIMARSSDEGTAQGLGWIDAEVNRFSDVSPTQRATLPHMGWNDVSPLEGDCIFRGMTSGARFYFLHSYYFSPNREKDVLAVTDYNGSYTSSVRSNNIFGVQFHPEKSHQWGIKLLQNFAEL